MYVLDTHASVVAILGLLNQEQEWNGKTVLRPMAYGSKVLSDTEMKYGAAKAEMFAVVNFVEKIKIGHTWVANHSSYGRQQSTQLVENVLNGPELHREMNSAAGWLQYDH